MASIYLAGGMLTANKNGVIKLNDGDGAVLNAVMASRQWPETRDAKSFSFLFNNDRTDSVKKLLDSFQLRDLEIIYALNISGSGNDLLAEVWKFKNNGELETATCIFDRKDRDPVDFTWESEQIPDDIKKYAEKRILNWQEGLTKIRGDEGELMRKV